MAEIVTETLLFAAVVTRDQRDYVTVELSTRRLTDEPVDVKMEQRGGRRSWTFLFGEEEEPIRVEGKTDEQERFAQALASRLGWAAPDPAKPSSGTDA